MEWISVETELPKNGEQVICLVEGYFANISDPLCQKRTLRIFQSTFHRSKGWFVPYCPDHFYVKYWMKKSDDPMLE